MRHYLICFDISHDKTRTRVSKLLEKYGLRVQESVFECLFKTETKKQALERKLQTILSESPEPETNIRFYYFNKDTVKYCHDIDQKTIMQKPAFVVL